MACDLSTIQAAACESGIGKLDSLIELLKVIAQLSCEIADAGSGGGTPGGGLNSVQFNDGGAFGGFGSYNSGTGLLTLTGNLTVPSVTGNLTGNVTGSSSLNVLKAGDTMTGLLTIAQATANTSNLALTGYSLTGANAQSMISGTGTWNTTGNPVALSLSIVNTASGATAKFLEFLGGAGGATSMFAVTKFGQVQAGDGASALTVGTPGLSFVGAPLVGFRRAGAGGTIGLIFTSAGADIWYTTASFITFRNNALLNWSSGTDPAVSQDVGFARNGIGIMAVCDGSTATTFRDIKVRTLFSNNAVSLVSTNTTLTDFAAASLGTLSNAPSAGNPAKWIAIVDNGTTRYIPTWV